MINAKRDQRFLLPLAFLFLPALAMAGTISDRGGPAPAVVDHGRGLNVVAEDMRQPDSGAVESPSQRVRDPELLARLQSTVAPDAASKSEGIGGEDVVVSSDAHHRECTMDIASNGDIYIALESGTAYDPISVDLLVFRSDDGGDTWTSWGSFLAAASDEEYFGAKMHIAEGNENRCYLSYEHLVVGSKKQIEVAYSDLGATPNWTVVVAMQDPDVWFSSPNITSDAITWEGYYLYLVGSGADSSGRDIWFARSRDYGATWETPYMIAELTASDRGYDFPSVSYGYGTYLHVAWEYRSYDDSFLSAIRYRRTNNYGNGGAAAWDPVQYLTTTTNGTDDRHPVIRASAVSNEVLLAFTRSSGSHYQDTGLFVSQVQGASFSPEVHIAEGISIPTALYHDPSAGQWVLGGGQHFFPYAPAIQTAYSTSLSVWSDEKKFVDSYGVPGVAWSPQIALDPSRANRIAASWTDIRGSGLDVNRLKFDAEWRNGPGYPDLRDWGPVELDAEPISPPALVDLTGNGTREIVFGDADGNIQAYSFAGARMYGYPIVTGEALSDGPVAIGALTPGGRNLIFAGTVDGKVLGYEVDGTPLNGWPVDLGTAAPTYVSLGAIGSPWVRVVAIGSGDKLLYRDYKGVPPRGIYSWTFFGGRTITAPPAIGDIDGDGINEVVVGPGATVYAFDPRLPTTKLSRSVSSVVSDQITLGDLDLDGEVEIVVPTENGTLYVMQEDESDYASFPYTVPSASPLTSAALAQCLGGSAPEIVYAARNWSVHAHYGDTGDEVWWSPVATGSGWYLYGAPIIGLIESTASDVLIGDRAKNGWGWANVGGTVPGWPTPLGDRCNLSPAIGDLAGDGETEVVFLTQSELLIYEVHMPENSGNYAWPMYGHNPRRTACLNCPEDVVTPVAEEGGSGLSHVSFAPPSPNPMSSSGSFRFAVPLRAAATLEVYDLRGRRVRTILREEIDTGERIVTWDGRDAEGREVAAGQYLARLRVCGPGMNEDMVRKVVVLR